MTLDCSRKSGTAFTMPEQLHDALDPVEIAELLPEDREQVEADEAGVLGGLVGRDVGPDLALRNLAVGRRRHRAGEVDEVPGPHRVRVVGGRLGHDRQLDAEVPETLLGRHRYIPMAW